MITVGKSAYSRLIPQKWVLHLRVGLSTVQTRLPFMQWVPYACMHRVDGAQEGVAWSHVWVLPGVAEVYDEPDLQSSGREKVTT
jgi:hypothetical protein